MNCISTFLLLLIRELIASLSTNAPSTLKPTLSNSFFTLLIFLRLSTLNA